MQFYDRPSGRSRINLRGSSSRPATREELLAQAKKSREQRAHLRLQHQAARTIQRLFRARSSVETLAQTTLDSSALSTDHVNTSLSKFVLLSGLLGINSGSLSSNISAVYQFVQSRPFVTALAKQLSPLILSSDSFLFQQPLIVTKAACLLLSAALQVLHCTSSYEWRDFNDEVDSVISMLRAACILIDGLRIDQPVDCAPIAKWGIIVHLTDLLRCTLSSSNSTPNSVSKRAKHKYDLSVAVTPHIWPPIEQSVLSLFERISRLEDSVIVKRLRTQFAISLLSVDRSVFDFKFEGRFEMFSSLVKALVISPVDTSEGNTEEVDNFKWNCVHRIDTLSLREIAMILGNVLALADFAWSGSSNHIRWPLISVISTLVHALPKDVWKLTTDDDDYDDGENHGRKGELNESDVDEDAQLVKSRFTEGNSGDVVMQNSTSSSSRTVKNGTKNSEASPSKERRAIVDTTTLRTLMNHVSSSLNQMVSEESVRNIFAAAVIEGHAAVLCVCDLFNFLTRRDRKLTVPLRDALALWRSQNADGERDKHILTSLWRECTTQVHNRQNDETDVVRTKDIVLRADAGPILSVFSATYAYLLYFQDVDEMFDSKWPFSPDEVHEISIILKQQLFNALFVRNSRLFVHSVSNSLDVGSNNNESAANASTSSSGSASSQKNMMTHVLRTEPGLLDDVTRLLSRLHAVDSQRKFTSGDTFWEAGHGALSSDSFVKDAIEAGPEVLMPAHEETSVGAVRQVRYRSGREQAVSGAGELLRVAPYLVPFTTRSKIFQIWVAKERDRTMAQQMGPMMMMAERTVQVRRNQIYEDAFRELNDLGQGLRATIRVKFIDEHGLEEAGIDGGGVFKEFMHEVLRVGFSPFSYGLFKSTPDGHIYPNPDAHVAVADAKTQFGFLGRLLGKAVFDGVLVDIPLAKFFRLKMLGEVNYPTDLMSMDPQMYKSMKILKSTPADIVEDLGLTFTVVNDGFGAAKEVELKPNGRNINVTGVNRIEYIHRLAHYRMNLQIKEESEAFLRGFYEIVPSELIRLFSHDELQLLISGKRGKIDLDDWRRNTRYSGGYNEDTPVIRWFWTAVSELEADEQAKMLQFVTSSPRAPLLGFAYLVPGFCIHRAEGNVRLPTASTCMNLLKLPEYPSLKVVREKLVYALQSNAGFDLS